MAPPSCATCGSTQPCSDAPVGGWEGASGRAGPNSLCAVCCARLWTGTTRKALNKAPPWPGDKRLGALGRVRPPAWEDALATSQGAWCRMFLHHKSRGTIVAGVHPRSNAALCCAGLMAGKTHAFPNRAPPWPGIKRVSAPGRVRPPAREDALAPSQDAGRQSTLHHKPRGPIVAGVPPRSGAALWCAGLKAGKTRALPNRAPPWPGIKRVSAPGRVRPPAREDALAPYQDAGRRGILHHKPRGTIVAGVHPRSDAALWCAGLKVVKR